MLVINACNRPSRKVILLQGFPKNISDLPSDEREVGIIENIDFKYRTSFMGNPVSCCPKQNQRQELCQTFLVDSLRDLDPNFNEISIILGIKCSNSTLDQICNIAILLFINFAHSMRNSRPAPTKEILKRFLAINFRNLCLFSKRFKKNIELVTKYNALNAESFFLSIWS